MSKDVPRSYRILPLGLQTFGRYNVHLAPSQRPLVFAHRGGAALRPENTLAAFDNGLALGADGLELDVHLSRDGVVVVHHDATLDRTTNGARTARALTADELAAVDAGYWFRGTVEGGPEFPRRGQGVGIPRLRDVLADTRGSRSSSSSR